MFENLLTGEEKPTSFDILVKLMEKDNAETKTDLELKQIKVQVLARWYRKIRTDEDPFIVLDECFELYNQLKMSYKRKGRLEIVKGVTDMKESMEQALLMQQSKDQK